MEHYPDIYCDEPIESTRVLWQREGATLPSADDVALEFPDGEIIDFEMMEWDAAMRHVEQGARVLNARALRSLLAEDVPAADYGERERLERAVRPSIVTRILRWLKGLVS